MSAHDQIDSFLLAIHARLNRFRLIDSFSWCLGIGSGVLLAVCLVYVLQGYAVPKFWFTGTAALIILATLTLWVIRAWTRDRTARFADRFFGLKDTIASYRHFKKSGRTGGFYDLQEKATLEKIENLSLEEIRYRLPGRLLAITAILLLACALMAFKKPSDSVLESLRIEEETTVKTSEINEHLEELIEELKKASTEEENEVLDPERLREWVEELKKTDDRKEALRQYAELERRLQEATQRIDQRKNEQLLSKAGEELQKDRENKALGKKLEEKKFRDAAEDVEKLKPETIDPKKLSEQRKNLAKLKSAAQRMASAAKAADRKGASGRESGASKSSGKSGANGSASNSGSGNSGGSSGTDSPEEGLEELLAGLEQSVKDFDGALSEADLETRQLGKCSDATAGKCENARNAVLSDLDELNKSLCKIGLKRECQSKLLAMCKKMGQCQSYLCQSKFSSLSQCLSPNAGGHKAGAGSVESRREGGDPLVDNGQYSQLEGIKGQGPGISSIEAAEDGDGVSTLRASRKQLDFQRQLESFVQREDVPEDVKEGVKEYFKGIHRPADE